MAMMPLGVSTVANSANNASASTVTAIPAPPLRHEACDLFAHHPGFADHHFLRRTENGAIAFDEVHAIENDSTALAPLAAAMAKLFQLAEMRVVARDEVPHSSDSCATGA